MCCPAVLLRCALCNNYALWYASHAISASKKGAKTKDGKKVKVAKKSDIKKRSAKVSPAASGGGGAADAAAGAKAGSSSKKASGGAGAAGGGGGGGNKPDGKALWAKVGGGGRISAKVDLAIPKGASARQGKSKYRHAVRQTAEGREEKDEVEEELKRRGTRMTNQ